MLLASTVHTYTELLGYPTVRKLPEKFFVLTHLIDEPKTIYLWILEENIPVKLLFKFVYKTEFMLFK